jgi:hypothetical protein
MQKTRLVVLLGLVVLLVLLVLLAGCEAYTETGARVSEHQGLNGGDVTARINKANGTAGRSIELETNSGLVLEADVTLTVAQGTFKIELLGEDDQVTLTLEASDGQSVSGRGHMVTDAFGEANYRVTATEAEGVEYSIVYTFR